MAGRDVSLIDLHLGRRAEGGGPSAAGTQDRRYNQAIAADEVITKKYAERGTSGEAQAAKEKKALIKKFNDDILNIDRYGKDAPKGRSFGQKNRAKKPKVNKPSTEGMAKRFMNGGAVMSGRGVRDTKMS